ncbi:hypothetical protein GTY82_22930 [Streptomyces sp. SID5476]|uniref:Serine/arginine repetitive matrix protein 2 n=2 Tax=Streptomyces TaxID=1883 RepID=M3FRK0_9ACTN|nr:hypothetical protein SBD_4447 [Streptomyces bottropensis ATCC 25435]MZD20048.1 hypothetical protein [Streptomyces sp. SID5476]
MNVRREKAGDGKGGRMTRWDAHQGRWVDDTPGRGSPWPRLTVAVALAALLGGGIGFGVWTLSRDEDGPARATAADSSPSTPPPSVSAAGPADDDGTDPATPKQSDPDSDAGDAPGYVHSDDPAGFTVDVPSGWKRTAKTPTDKPTVVTYDSPDGSRVLQLFLVSESSPAESMDLAENENYGFARLPGYRALDRSAADDDSYSEVVYRFDGEGEAGPRQVVDHRFRTAGDKIYGVRLSAPESTPLDELREPVTTVVTSLCPTGATCVRG